MGRSRYKIYEDWYPYFITSSIVQGYPLFSIPQAAEIVLDSLNFLQENREVNLYGYVIMENHIHFVALGSQLAEKIRLFKSYSARAILNYLETNGRSRLLGFFRQNKLKNHTRCSYQIWQEGFHPKQIRDENMMIQKLEYIHFNPVKRGYVDQPEDWRYSSARNYSGGEILLEVKLYYR